MLDNLSWRHVPALITGASTFFGGLINGILDPKGSLSGYGMSEKIASSREAQIVYYGHSMRTSTFGLLVLVFYLQGNIAAVDVTMAIIGGYCGIADVFLLYKYGNRGKVPVRLISVLFIAAWGLAGMTAESH